MLSVNLNKNPPWSSGVPFKILKALGGAEKTLIVGGAVGTGYVMSQLEILILQLNYFQMNLYNFIRFWFKC